MAIIKDTTTLANEALTQFSTEGTEQQKDITLTDADPLSYGSVSGAVTSGGSGVQDAVVKLYRVSGTTVTLVAHTATFGASGSYEFSNLPVVASNTYYVMASKDGYSTSSPASVALSETTPVTNANLTLTDNGTNNKIYGIVTDASAPNPAIANAVAMLISSVDGSIYAITQTNGDGEYVFYDVAPGTYTLNISKTGYSNFSKSETVAGTDQSINEDTQLSTSTVATKGTVNGIVSKGGAAVSATVFLYKVVSNVETLEATTVSASDGSYLFGNLDTGTDYIVKAKIYS